VKDDGKQVAPRFSFLGGAMPLDFCNTVDWHSSDAPTDRLRGYEDVVLWAVAAGVASEDAGNAMIWAARSSPAEAEAVFAEARSLRETAFRLFTAEAHGKAPAPADVAALNAAWTDASSQLVLTYTEDGYAWKWRDEIREAATAALRQPLYAVARAAVELLLSPQARHIRRCEGPPGCGWLFLDASKNRSRRWCSMQDCGNREKMRRYQQRKKESRGSGRAP